MQSKQIIKRSHGATLKPTDKNYIAMLKLIKADLQTKDGSERKTRSKNTNKDWLWLHKNNKNYRKSYKNYKLQTADNLESTQN